MNIVNFKKFKGLAINIGRPSIYGNPFTHLGTQTLAEKKVSTRREAVLFYLEWLLTGKHLDRSPAKIVEAILAGDLWEGHKKKLPLSCWCMPEACHGHALSLVRDPEEMKKALANPEEFLRKLADIIDKL